jgi:uncharacterized membrane protein YkvA (DUF1232 family)
VQLVEPGYIPDLIIVITGHSDDIIINTITIMTILNKVTVTFSPVKYRDSRDSQLILHPVALHTSIKSPQL